MTYTPEMRDWMLEHGDKCWRCGQRCNLQCHHFVRGCQREKNDQRTTAVLCVDCHSDEHLGEGIGLLAMLALKRRHDPENYFLAHVNRLRGRSQNAITEEDVDAWEGSDGWFYPRD